MFGLGAVLYELLSGRPPYSGPNAVEAAKTASFDPLEVLAPEIPSGLARICHKAMAKRPTDRYSQTSEFAADLESWTKRRIGERDTSAYGSIFLPNVHYLRNLSRNPVTLSLGGAILFAVCLVVMLLGTMNWPGRDTGSSTSPTATDQTAKEGAEQPTAEFDRLNHQAHQAVNDAKSAKENSTEQKAHYAKAILSYEQALDLELALDEEASQLHVPKRVRACKYLAWIYYREGDHDRAEASLERGTETVRQFLRDSSFKLKDNQALSTAYAECLRDHAWMITLGKSPKEETRLGDAIIEYSNVLNLSKKYNLPDIDTLVITNNLALLHKQRNQGRDWETAVTLAIELGIETKFAGKEEYNRTIVEILTSVPESEVSRAKREFEVKELAEPYSRVIEPRL